MHKTNDDESDFGQLLREAIKERDMLLPKTSLMAGRFVIERLLGSGGMGVVHEAFDNQRETSVALKMLTSVDASSIYRLKQEFRALSDVVHPNLVALHELFCDQDRWFFTMELLPGKTLFDAPAESLEEDRIRSIFSQLATGIQAIHDAGKLHRDLKPTNVMLTPEGRVVILDFGLVSDKEAGGVGQTIIDESISGTPLYMAPEQAAAEPATARSDWYAFGVMLFEALTGRPPFGGRGHSVMMRKQQEDAPRPSSFVTAIPGDLEALCLGLLQRNPEFRHGWQQVAQVLGPEKEPRDSLVPQDEEIPFLGRIEEFQALFDAFKATEQERPVMVYVHGVSGVGKTALVERFLSSLQQHGRAVVLTGRCYESESVPFKACDSLIDALSRYLKKSPPERATNFLPTKVHAIAQLFPALQRLDFISKLKQRHPLPRDPTALRQVAFEALKELLTRIAAQEPLVLFVDDLQWSDVDGAKLLSSILSRPNPPALLLIGAYRSQEGKSGVGLKTLRQRVHEFGASEVREIALKELSEEESESLARRLLSADKKGRASQIVRESEGNPFFITELSRFTSSAQDQAEPISVQEAIQRKVATLDESERQVLQAISVSARPMDQSLLRAITGADDVAKDLRRLQADRLIRKVASERLSEVTTYHDKIREAVAAAMDDRYIKSWHAKLARTMEAYENPDLIALTEHLMGAGEQLKAGAYASRAAEHAVRSLAFDNAARLYRIALELNPGDRENQRKLQTKLGMALASAGRAAEAAPIFMQAAEDALLAEQQELRRLAAHCWLMTGHMTEGVRELDTVLRNVGLKLRSSPAASIGDLLANRFRLRLHGLKFRERRTDEVSSSELAELRARWTAATGLLVADPIQSGAFNSRFLRLALRSGIVEQIVLGLCTEAISRSFDGGRGRFLVDKYLNLARDLSRSVEDPEVLAHLHYATGCAAYLLGETPKAKEHLKRAEKMFIEECTGVNAFLNMTRNFLGGAYVLLGSWRELIEQWDIWIKDAQERNDLIMMVWQRTMTQGTWRYLAVDRADEAREQVAKGISLWPRQGFDTVRLRAGMADSFIEIYDGNYQKAFEIADDFCKRLSKSFLYRSQFLRVHTRSMLGRTALKLASISNDRNPLLKIARQQVKQLSKEQFPYAQADLLRIKGGIAYLQGDLDSAVKWLREAVVSHHNCQAKLSEAAINRQLGRVLGGVEGRFLIAQADATMRQEGVVRPDRVAATLVAGFPD